MRRWSRSFLFPSLGGEVREGGNGKSTRRSSPLPAEGRESEGHAIGFLMTTIERLHHGCASWFWLESFMMVVERSYFDRKERRALRVFSKVGHHGHERIDGRAGG